MGNHTYNHLNGWKTGSFIYVKNVVYAKQLIKSNLFRPPYGRITSAQVKELSPDFNIIMWGVLSGDFDISLSAEACFNNVAENVKPGSIIVFHDSEKAFPRLEYALPKTLDLLSSQGYEMKAILERS